MLMCFVFFCFYAHLIVIGFMICRLFNNVQFNIDDHFEGDSILAILGFMNSKAKLIYCKIRNLFYK